MNAGSFMLHLIYDVTAKYLSLCCSVYFYVSVVLWNPFFSLLLQHLRTIYPLWCQPPNWAAILEQELVPLIREIIYSVPIFLGIVPSYPKRKKRKRKRKRKKINSRDIP